MSTIANHVLTPVATRVNTIVLVFTLISGLIVFLRLFTRFVLSKAAGFEDACIAFAMALAVALAVTIAQQAMHGLGKHDARLTGEERDVLLKSFWAGLWIYNLTLTSIKAAIVIQYIRIFPVPRFRMACYIVLALVIVVGGWTVGSSIFICTPVAFSWDKDIENGHCLNQFAVWFTNAGLNIAQDVFILFMPLPVIKTLQITKGQKTGLIATFGLGAAVTLVSVIRLSSLQSISNSTDIPWDNPSHASLSAVEVNVGIVCACLPAMRPLFALMMPEYFSGPQQYTNTTQVDIERRIHSRKPSAGTMAYTTRSNTPRTMTPRSITPQPATSLQNLRPVLSRTPSGKFSVGSNYTQNNNSRVFFQSPPTFHSRAGSNTSTSSAALRPKPLNIKPLEPKPLRFQGEINPLRMSPITPFSPPKVQGTWPATSAGFTARHGNGSSTTLGSMGRPKTSGSTKPLPITPFPVG